MYVYTNTLIPTKSVALLCVLKQGRTDAEHGQGLRRIIGARKPLHRR